MHCIICIASYALHSLHYILCFAFYAIYSMHYIMDTLVYALYFMHYTLSIVIYVVLVTLLRNCWGLWWIMGVTGWIVTGEITDFKAYFTVSTFLFQVLNPLLVSAKNFNKFYLP